MASNGFLHGTETVDVKLNGATIRTVKSGIIAVIGTAYMGAVNEPTLVLSSSDSADFGDAAFTEFTIADALADIAQLGTATTVVINVLDPAVHTSIEPDEPFAFDPATARARLGHPGLSQVELKSADGDTTYNEGTDYQLKPETGDVTWLATGTMALDGTFSASYHYADPSKVTAADIIGGITAAGTRTGLMALDDLYSRFGFTAKILVCPVFETMASVAAAIVTAAERQKAIGYRAAPAGITPQQAIEGRGPAGSINFNTSSRRMRLLYPYVRVADKRTGGTRLKSMSALAAGLRASVDAREGFWYSNSNHELPAVLGLERNLSAALDGSETETNLLNAAGITTVLNSYGTGLRLWGNRNAAFPTEGGLLSFESVVRTKDIIDESIRMASLPYVDAPMSIPLLDCIVEDVNAYGRKLIGDGALLGFNAWIDPRRNPAASLADGQGVVSYKFTPPPPLERLTYESEITDEYLVTLTGGQP